MIYVVPSGANFLESFDGNTKAPSKVLSIKDLHLPGRTFPFRPVAISDHQKKKPSQQSIAEAGNQTLPSGIETLEATDYIIR